MIDGPDFKRFRRALLLDGEPDRVPLIEPGVEMEVKSAFLGKPVANLETEVEFWVKAGYDYVPLGAGVRTVLQNRLGMYRTKTPGENLASGRRSGTSYSVYTENVSEREWAEEGQGVIRTLDDFERFPWPAVDDFDLSAFTEVKRYLPPDMKIVAQVGFIFLPAWRLMGFTAFCEALTDNPELVSRLFQKLGTLEYAVAQRLVDYDCVGAIWVAEDIAYSEGLMISPRYLREYLFPWYGRIGDLCRARGLPYIHHSDGRLYQVIDDLIHCGVRALHPIEPKAMDIVGLKRRYGHRLCLCGNIDLGYTLTLGSPQEVEAEVKQRIHDLAPGGGYCLGSSNSIPEYVPLENYRAMLDAALKNGRYPIGV
ncbi:MAG: uroporphyrinogen decarboxylase family protein [Chloroflexota bacterium]